MRDHWNDHRSLWREAMAAYVVAGLMRLATLVIVVLVLFYVAMAVLERLADAGGGVEPDPAGGADQTDCVQGGGSVEVQTYGLFDRGLRYLCRHEDGTVTEISGRRAPTPETAE